MANAGDDTAVQEHFDDFYEEVYEELANFGKVEELVVCANLGDHMIGNVYVKLQRAEAVGAYAKKPCVRKSPAVALRNYFKRGGVKGSRLHFEISRHQGGISRWFIQVYAGTGSGRSYRCRDICAQDMQVQVQMTSICYYGPKSSALGIQRSLIVTIFGTITWTLSSHGHTAPPRSAAMCVRFG